MGGMVSDGCGEWGVGSGTDGGWCWRSQKLSEIREDSEIRRLASRTGRLSLISRLLRKNASGDSTLPTPTPHPPHPPPPNPRNSRSPPLHAPPLTPPVPPPPRPPPPPV